MSDKLAVILVSADPKVLEMGLMYARSAVKQGWMNDTLLYFFGPSEVTISTDPDLQAAVREIIAEGTVPVACKWCSDKYGVSDLLIKLGCNVDYVGAPISKAIQDGYVPMTW